MESTMAAIEMTGTVDEHRQLLLDGVFPVPGPLRVRVLVLHPLDTEWEETEWLQAAVRSPAFAFLHETEEELYTLSDGKPFDDQV